MEEILYDFWAGCLQNGYIGRLVDITENAGGARKLFAMSEEQMIKQLGITKRLAGYIAADRNEETVKRFFDETIKQGIRYVCYKDPDFPDKLRTIPSPPYAIFVKGKMPEKNRAAVSIIGARECSEYGRVVAEYFGSGLARNGVDIISGMAWGIDGIAQMAAVNAGGNSYAVLGCGVDVIYPRNNRRLYERLCENNNGIISEYKPGTAANSRLFPPRNRLISALCDILLVVEAKAKSGTLITVDMAADQGRCVMTVPGRITDILSVGCLKLLQEGAIAAYNIEGVLQELENQAACGKHSFNRAVKTDEKETADNALAGTKEIDSLSQEEKKIYDCMGYDPLSSDSIAVKAGMPIERVLVVLTKLEMRGLVKTVGGAAFVKNTIVM